MSAENNCPKCKSENTYQDGSVWNCPECFHEWKQAAPGDADQEVAKVKKVVDCNGNQLVTGDSITVIKDLKVKGAGAGLKSGTKVKGIRIIDSQDGHDIACKIDGMGSLFLKAEFVRKV